MSRSGFVFLEELTDAEASLDWALDALQHKKTDAVSKVDVDVLPPRLAEDREGVSGEEEGALPLGLDDSIDPLFALDWDEGGGIIDGACS